MPALPPPPQPPPSNRLSSDARPLLRPRSSSTSASALADLATQQHSTAPLPPITTARSGYGASGSTGGSDPPSGPPAVIAINLPSKAAMDAEDSSQQLAWQRRRPWATLRLGTLALGVSALVLVLLSGEVAVMLWGSAAGLSLDTMRRSHDDPGRWDACPPPHTTWTVAPLASAHRKTNLSTPFEGSGASAVPAGVGYFPSPNHFRSCESRAAPSNATTDEKYFWEVKGVWHSDVRFYNGPLPAATYNATTGRTTYERLPVDRAVVQPQLTELVAAWSRFLQASGFKAWLAHGTLMGWYWSRRVLPWDDDIDMQMTFRDLEEMAARYNGTRWEDRFLVDVNPNAVNRFRQRRNIIDARFIDTHTGRFVDVTALGSPLAPSVIATANASAADAVVVSCKSVHNYTLGDLFPLRVTVFQGSPCFVPYDVERCLHSEYGKNSTQRRVFRNHRYNETTKLWDPPAAKPAAKPAS
ncbi:hypothetical protein HK405_000916 [Cladochytrium tenue]|nr:hypothetical protein HK405_000916 [Cladochytrium tenue]